MNLSPLDSDGGLPRRAFLTALGLAGAGAVCARAASGSSSQQTEVIKETPIIGACGPYALANALVNGDAACRRAFRGLAGGTSTQRAQVLIDRYGAKPSETYGIRRARFVNGAGISTEDLTFLTKDFLAQANLPQAAGDWLDQRPGDSSHVRQVHGQFSAALGRGLPPLLEVRAFAADSSARQPSWINLYAHWLTLIGIEPGELPASGSGFLCRFADSFTGRVISGFAYEERVRPFMATRGFSLRPDGTKDWHWLSGHPYILLDLPDVPLAIQTRPWHERTLVACTYLIHRSA